MILILACCAHFTSIISGVAGMAGGVLLLSLMTFFLDLRVIVPIHGVVQFTSNASRTWYLKSFIKKEFFLPFLLGAPIGAFIAYFILSSITDTHYLYLFLSLLIFWALFKPRKLPEFRLHSYQWFLLGIVSAIQGALVGATGPLLAIFYLRKDLTKEEIVATKASQQIVTHLLKVPLFLSLEFDYIANIDLILGMSMMSVAGSFIGVKILKRTNEKLFKLIFKVLLLLAGLRMLFKFGEVYFA